MARVSKLPFLLLVVASFQLRAQTVPGVLRIVYSEYNITPANPALKKKNSSDTIFYEKGKAIEILTSIKQSDINGRVSVEQVHKGYNLIDLERNQCSFVKSIDSIKNNNNLTWEPLIKKQFGIPIEFALYRNESLAKKDTVYNGEKAIVCHFINKFGSNVTAILGRTLQDHELHFYDLERKFGKRLLMLQFQSKQGAKTIIEINEAIVRDKHLVIQALKKVNAK